MECSGDASLSIAISNTWLGESNSVPIVYIIYILQEKDELLLTKSFSPPLSIQDYQGWNQWRDFVNLSLTWLHFRIEPIN